MDRATDRSKTPSEFEELSFSNDNVISANDNRNVKYSSLVEEALDPGSSEMPDEMHGSRKEVRGMACPLNEPKHPVVLKEDSNQEFEPKDPLDEAGGKRYMTNYLNKDQS